MAVSRAVVYSLLAMFLCAALTRIQVVFFFFAFTIDLSLLAIIGMFISLGVALLLAATGAPVSVKEKENVVVLLAATAMNVLIYLSILSSLPGAIIFLAILAASVGLILWTKTHFPGEFSIARGLLAGFVMFILVLLIVYVLFSVTGSPVEETLQLAAWGWWSATQASNATSWQLEALINFFIVAPCEEMMRYSTLAALLVGGAAMPEATWLANAWFIFLHTPTRVLYGWRGLVVLAIIAVALIPFWLIAGRHHPVSAMVAHATYNVLVSSYGPLLLLEIPVLLLLIYLLRKREVGAISIEYEKIKPEAIAKVVEEVVKG